MIWFDLFGFYGISIFVGYLMPNPFSHKYTVLFQTIQFSMSKQTYGKKYANFKLFSLVESI